MINDDGERFCDRCGQLMLPKYGNSYDYVLNKTTGKMYCWNCYEEMKAEEKNNEQSNC